MDRERRRVVKHLIIPGSIWVVFAVAVTVLIPLYGPAPVETRFDAIERRLDAIEDKIR